eukprot:12196781-Prorocentrum_lima.AAC.1
MCIRDRAKVVGRGGTWPSVPGVRASATQKLLMRTRPQPVVAFLWMANTVVLAARKWVLWGGLAAF